MLLPLNELRLPPTTPTSAAVNPVMVSFAVNVTDRVPSLVVDLLATALREANEEVAIQKSQVEFIRTLSKVYIPKSNFLVSPFLSYGSFRPNFIKEISEVSGILEFPLNDLLEMKISITSLTNYSKNSIEVPCFIYNKKIIWGATAMILSELKMIIQNTLIK